MTIPLRVLIVEDSEDDTLLLLRELRKGGYGPVYERAETPEAMNSALENQEWDIVISDYVLPKFSGLGALDVLRKNGQDLPFIIVSGNIGEDIAVEAMKAGAHDYIIKGNLKRLNPAIERELREAEARRKHRRSEEELSRLAAAVECAPDAVVIADTDWIVRYVNPAFKEITGYSPEEIIGRSLHILRSGKHDEKFYNEIWNNLKQGRNWRGHLTVRKKDGTSYEEEVTYSPVKDSSGNIRNYVAIKRDITDKLRLESIAEAVNTMNNIGYVFSGIRHEIGNPINSIKMTLGVLKRNFDKYDKADILEYIERALSESARVEYLLKTLRNFNMYETPELQNIDLRSFFDKFSSLVKGDLSLKKGIDFRVSVEQGAEFSYADPRALQQILLNICNNAADALEGRPGPSIEIKVTKLSDMILIRVNDNGAGISMEEQANLFKPFYTTKVNGTGLGLVIVKKMLAGMNGIIEIRSEKNVGTTMDIIIPGEKYA
jgi:PAS domain S-box-containing protein